MVRPVPARCTRSSSSSPGRRDAVEFVKLDIDENPVNASRYDVLSIPTVILFAEGEAQAMVVGARPAKHFREAFAAYLGDASAA